MAAATKSRMGISAVVIAALLLMGCSSAPPRTEQSPASAGNQVPAYDYQAYSGPALLQDKIAILDPGTF